MMRKLSPAPLVYVALLMLPIYWLVIMSLKSNAEIAGALTFYPHQPTVSNYRTILGDPAWYFGYVNAAIYVLMNVVISVFVAVPAAYGFSRYRFFGDRYLFFGFLAFRMACLYPRTFAAVAPVMALMPKELAEQQGPAVPMLVIHGTADSIVKEEAETLFGGRTFAVLPMSKTIQYWVDRNGAGSPEVTILPDGDEDGTRTELRRYPGKAEVRYYRVENGGHTWPGGKERAPRFIVGRTARDWSATEEIWTFFRTHSR